MSPFLTRCSHACTYVSTDGEISHNFGQKDKHEFIFHVSKHLAQFPLILSLFFHIYYSI